MGGRYRPLMFICCRTNTVTSFTLLLRFRYVSYTSGEDEHNLDVFQFYRRIYYRVSQPISEGAELRVWIGKDYANLLGLGMGELRPRV